LTFCFRPPSLDTVSRTYRNIDFVISKQSESIANLATRISKLDLTSAVMSQASTRDPRLPNQSRRPFDITPSVPATTASALNAEQSAQKLKLALMSLRQEPLLNTVVPTAMSAPTTFETPRGRNNKVEQRSPGPGFLPVSESQQSHWDPNESLTSSFKSRRGVGTKHHSKPVQLRKSLGHTLAPLPPAFDWGPVPKLEPMETLSPNVTKSKSSSSCQH
jgi:nucleoporin NUP159